MGQKKYFTSSIKLRNLKSNGINEMRTQANILYKSYAKKSQNEIIKIFQIV